jgi:hypothetical protein
LIKAYPASSFILLSSSKGKQQKKVKLALVPKVTYQSFSKTGLLTKLLEQKLLILAKIW